MVKSQQQLDFNNVWLPSECHEVQQRNIIRMRGQQRPVAESLCDEIHVRSETKRSLAWENPTGVFPELLLQESFCDKNLKGSI